MIAIAHIRVVDSILNDWGCTEESYQITATDILRRGYCTGQSAMPLCELVSSCRRIWGPICWPCNSDDDDSAVAPRIGGDGRVINRCDLP